MQTQPHISLTTILVGAVLALAVMAPTTFAALPPEYPSAVPSQPGAATNPVPDITAARAQERYMTSYGDPKPLAQVGERADDGGIDWTSIGIVVGVTVLLLGALIPLFMRTRHRSGRTHVAA